MFSPHNCNLDWPLPFYTCIIIRIQSWILDSTAFDKLFDNYHTIPGHVDHSKRSLNMRNLIIWCDYEKISSCRKSVYGLWIGLKQAANWFEKRLYYFFICKYFIWAESQINLARKGFTHPCLIKFKKKYFFLVWRHIVTDCTCLLNNSIHAHLQISKGENP